MRFWRQAERTDRLERLASRAGLTIAWERIWPVLAAALTIGAFFVAVSWLGLWIASPRWVRIAGVLGFGILFFLGLAPLAFFKAASRDERLARIDRDAPIPHNPARSLQDRLANGASDPTTQALWTLHRQRLEKATKQLSIGPPRPRLANRDRYAVRAAALVVLVASAFVAGPEKYPRLAAALDWRTAGAAGQGFRVDVWIDPPPYTRRAPFLLANETLGNFLAGLGGALQKKAKAPVGSKIIVRSANLDDLSFTARGGLELREERPQSSKTAAVKLASDSEESGAHERLWSIRGDGVLTIRRYGLAIAKFDLVAIPDRPPTITLVKKPRANVRGSLTLDYRMNDDYGVRSAEADFTHPRLNGRTVGAHSLVAPPKLALTLPSGANGLGTAETIADLSEHPWAGARVTMTLSAKDDGGNTGYSAPVEITLPQRSFTNPLARALVEQRRELVLEPERRDRVLIAIKALMIAPEIFKISPSVYLGLGAIALRLQEARANQDLISTADFIWKMALRIEDGDLTNAEQSLRSAEQKLRDAIQRRASPQEIQKLMKQLRASLDRFLQALSQQARQSAQGQASSPTQRTVTPRDLQSMLKQLQNLAQSGDLASAQRMLDQLQNLMENLQTARGGQQNPLNRALNALDQMTRDQERLRDQTFEHGKRTNPGAQQSPLDQRGQKNANGESLPSLRQQQDALRKRLQQLQQRLQQFGLDTKKGLNGAEQAMRQAERSLKRGRSGQDDAVQEQGQALEALRQGAQSLAQQIQQNAEALGMGNGFGQGGEGGLRGGQDDGHADPLGRDIGRSDSFSRYDPMGIPAEQRAQQVLEELRRRIGNVARPQEELDYFDRLLHPY